MKVMVTGANGQLGHEVCARLSALSLPYTGVDIADFDITDSRQVVRAMSAWQPDCVIHCAAMTAVDKAEQEPALCRKVNVTGTRNIAAACKDLQSKLVFLSTDYVFAGDSEAPYETDSPTGPLNVYGQSKLAGEAAVRDLLKKYFIVRTSWLFGTHGGNFIHTMLELGQNSETLSVVDDQVSSPTYAVDLARLLCDMIQTERYGVYQATNEGFCSKFELTEALVAEAGLPCRVLPVATSQFVTPAARPLQSRLSKRSLADAGFAPLPPWRDALRRYLKELRK